MGLKEMENTAVVVNTEEEAEELRGYYYSHGWPFPKAPLISKGRAMYVLVGKGNLSWFASDNYNGRVLITLAQFKERNGIMKYEKGQILTDNSDGDEIAILEVVGSLYVRSRWNKLHLAGDFITEKELDEEFTIKTDDPEMVELTLEDVAKLKGIPVETLRIKD